MAKKLVPIRGARWSTPVESGTCGGGGRDTVDLQRSAGQGHRRNRDSTNDSSSIYLRDSLISKHLFVMQPLQDPPFIAAP